jgi:hypoxanthine phosphoribosyltransferase
MSDGSERLDLLISERRIRARVAALARRIERDYQGRELSLVVVLKGAFVFVADLARQIGIPFTIGFISASSYGSGTRSSGAVALGGVDRLEVGARDVLVVEDILDTGRTSAAILESLRRRGRPPSRCARCCVSRRRSRSICRSNMPVSTSPTSSSSAGAWITPSATVICAGSIGSFSTAPPDSASAKISDDVFHCRESRERCCSVANLPEPSRTTRVDQVSEIFSEPGLRRAVWSYQVELQRYLD